MIYFINHTILFKVLPYLRVSPLLLMVIITITTLYASFNVVYFQSIESGIDFNSELVLGAGLIVSSPKIKVKRHRLTNAEQLRFTLPAEKKDILVGLLLGDLSCSKQKVNTRLKFAQGVVHKEYLSYLYDLFQSYCPMGTRTLNQKPHPVTGKVHSTIYFNTYSLFCFNELYNLFYPLGKKVIPATIGKLLTPIGLAYLLCDDGCYDKSNRAVVISTDCYTKAEVELLASVLMEKFQLKCTLNKVQYKQDNFKIRISAKSLPELQKMLGPLMPPMMLYKIGL